MEKFEILGAYVKTRHSLHVISYELIESRGVKLSNYDPLASLQSILDTQDLVHHLF